MSSKKKMGPQTNLKAERVQEELAAAVSQPVSPAAVQDRLKAERVQLRLKRMPGWSLVHDGKSLDRARQFHQPDDAVDFATLVLRMAGREAYPAQVHVDGKRVVLTLQGHSVQGERGGITDNLLDFAASLG
jgi:pterin-4a-carbinolamine dehydratase